MHSKKEIQSVKVVFSAKSPEERQVLFYDGKLILNNLQTWDLGPQRPNAVFPTDIQDYTYSISTEYHYSLIDSHTISKLIFKKFSLLKAIHCNSVGWTLYMYNSAMYIRGLHGPDFSSLGPAWPEVEKISAWARSGQFFFQLRPAQLGFK